MASTNTWIYSNSIGQNHFGFSNRQFQGNQLHNFPSNLGTGAMKPNFSAYNNSVDVDRPLMSYINQYSTIDESLGYLSSRNVETNASEGLEDNFDFASYMEMSDTDLMNQFLPDALEVEQFFGTTNHNQPTAFEGEGGITDEIPEQPPTPTLPPQDDDGKVVIAKRTVANKRKQPAKRPRRQRPRRERGNRSIHLWEFLQEMLNNSEENASYIKWISKREGVFQLVNSSGVARLWGQRKNRKNMTYEKMSRALRYYYEKDILERVPNARLIYKFGGKTKIKEVSEHVDDSLSDSSEN